MTPTRTRALRKSRFRTPLSLVTALLAGVGAAGVLVAAAVPAQAMSTTAHDPFGALSSVKAVTGGVQISGWAADRDALTTNLTVYASVDSGALVSRTVTSLPNAAVTTKYKTGGTPAYSVTVPVSSGAHKLCMVASNVGAGISVPVGCTALPVGTSLTSTQIAARSPIGSITAATSASTSVRYQGWAYDPDWIGGHLRVVLYVAGAPALTVYSTGRAATPPAPGANQSLWSISVPVSSGTHIGCVWVVNTGWGSNKLLGCRGTDTRGGPGTGALPSPAANKVALADALKHKGQPYSWGATGPSSWDCSGLVQHSYRTAGLTLPRVSSDQARAARLIPASRAVPGDLVFLHDNEGDVYHVGLYVKPGQMFAAIDYGYGVNYQTIWDPASATYGSLTHT